MSVDCDAVIGYGYLVPQEKMPCHPEDFEYENPESGVDCNYWRKTDYYDKNSPWFCGYTIGDARDVPVQIPSLDFYAYEYYTKIANKQLSSIGLKPSDAENNLPTFILFASWW